MTGSVKEAHSAAGRLAALLIDASTEAISAAGGHAGGVYLRSRTPGVLRLAVLSGLPGPLFRPWWRLHVDSPFPVADSYRLGVQVVLPNATETMRRYAQFAAGLPFDFGSLYVPVVSGSTTYGVLTVLRPAVTDAADLLSERDRVVRLAQILGAALRGLEEEDSDQVAWDGEPMYLRPPTASTSVGRVGRFAWDPTTTAITLDDDLHTLLGVPPSEFPGTAEAFADAVAPSDAHRVLGTLRDTAAGRPPALPLYLRDADGALRLLDLWTAHDPPAEPAVRGVVVTPGPAPTADSAADLLPDGVFCLDRLGLVVYANPRAAQLLGRPAPSSSAATCGRPCPGWAAPTSRTTCARPSWPRTRSTSTWNVHGSGRARMRRGSMTPGWGCRAAQRRTGRGCRGTRRSTSRRPRAPHRSTSRRHTAPHRSTSRRHTAPHRSTSRRHTAPQRGTSRTPRAPRRGRCPRAPRPRRRTPTPRRSRTKATGWRCPCIPVPTG